jgi:multicomponent Na+:H+ antiporter subunit D
MGNLTFVPIALPFAAFCLTLLVYGRPKLQQSVSIGAAGAYLAFAGWLLVDFGRLIPLTIQAGDWPAPFGISLIIDSLSALMIAVTGIIYLGATIYTLHGVNAEDHPSMLPLLNVLMVGISGAFITGDLFNLYVWFEVTLLASFVLMSLGQQSVRLVGALKYVALNLVSSLVFLMAVGLIYGAAHTLNLVDLKGHLLELQQTDPAYVTILGVILFSAFAIKAGLFPFYSWLPASYHTISPAVSAVFAGLLTKVGLYAMFRVSLIVFPASDTLTRIILWLAPLTMLFGVLGAITQTNIRRILGFHIVSQVGYISLAGAFMAADEPALRLAGFAAGIFYMIHHILVKTSLYLVSGLIHQATGSEELKELGGLRFRHPYMAILFAIPALSLAGLPPSSGFWAKLALFKAALSAEYYIPTAAMIVAGFLTVFSMVKIWNGAFWSAAPPSDTTRRPGLPRPMLGCTLLVIVSLTIGLLPDLLMDKALEAANQLISRPATEVVKP